jgi:hypothetical protein
MFGSETYSFVRAAAEEGLLQLGMVNIIYDVAGPY